VLRTVSPTLREWGVIVAGAVVPVLVVELVKWWQRATRPAGKAGSVTAA
jgi:hypothetical protein